MLFQVIPKTTEQINSEAEAFLSTYHPSLSIPVPIEEIIGLQLKIDIIPIPGLKNTTELLNLDIDAFISSDFKSITVDKYTQESLENRYRFTLAHEISHKILHEYLYSQLKFDNTSEWTNIINDIPVYERSIVEKQADEFTGLVLVPRKILKEEFEKSIKEVERLSKISFAKNPNFVIDYAISGVLTKRFVVSEPVARIRLERDGLIDKKHFL